MGTGNEAEFSKRVQLAHKLLDAEPDIKNKMPVAAVPYMRLALVETHSKKNVLDVADACHSKWPKYFCIDTWAYYFLMPQWLGTDREAERYIAERSDAISGARGDEVYAQLVWYEEDGLEDLFTKASTITWKRTKAGFQQIFKDFPDDMDARLEFIQLAYRAKDLDSVKSLFDDLKKSAAPAK